MTDPHPHAEAKERLINVTLPHLRKRRSGSAAARLDEKAITALLQENEELRSRATKAEAENAALIGVAFCCSGCGSSRTMEELKASGHVSCCPERELLNAREWRSRAAHHEARATKAEGERDSAISRLRDRPSWPASEPVGDEEVTEIDGRRRAV